MIWYRDGSCYQKSRQNCQQIIGSYFSHRRVKNRQWHIFFISQVMERGCKIKFAGLITDKKWLSKTLKTDKRRLKRNSSGGNWQPGFVPWRKIMNRNWGRKNSRQLWRWNTKGWNLRKPPVLPQQNCQRWESCRSKARRKIRCSFRTCLSCRFTLSPDEKFLIPLGNVLRLEKAWQTWSLERWGTK